MYIKCCIIINKCIYYYAVTGRAYKVIYYLVTAYILIGPQIIKPKKRNNHICRKSAQHTHLYFCVFCTTKWPCTRARKNARKTSRGKKPVATRVKKIKIQSCFPFAIANRITTFSTLRSCNKEKKNTEAWTTHIVCQVIRFLLCF